MVQPWFSWHERTRETSKVVLNLGRIGTFSREYIVVLVSRIPSRISGQTFNAAARTQWTWPSSSGFDQSFEISAILRNSRLVQRYGLTLSFAVSFIFRSFSSYSIYFFVGLFSRMFFLSSNFLSMVTLLLVLFSRFFTLHEESLRHENLRLQRWKEFRFHREYRRWMAVGKSRCSSMGETLG